MHRRAEPPGTAPVDAASQGPLPSPCPMTLGNDAEERTTGEPMLEVRKIVTTTDETHIEGGKAAETPLRLHGVAAVLRNPWADPPWLRDHLSNLFSNVVPITFFRTVISCLICIAYVCFTYLGSIPRLALLLMRLFALLMLVFLFLVIVNSERPLWVIFHPLTIIELLSIASLLLADHNDWLNFSFLQAYVVMSGYFSLETFLEASFSSNATQRLHPLQSA